MPPVRTFAVVGCSFFRVTQQLLVKQNISHPVSCRPCCVYSDTLIILVLANVILLTQNLGCLFALVTIHAKLEETQFLFTTENRS